MSKQRIMPADHPTDWPMPVSFSHGWRLGRMVFVGGQISAGKAGDAIGIGDVEAQSRNTFDNIALVLRDAGASWEDVVKLNTYIAFDGPPDELCAYWERVVAVQAEYLPAAGPVTTAVQVAGFNYVDVLIEVEAIAMLASPDVMRDAGP
jgi:2-iminobutanoate/2-iminopropanoate deaminase